MSERGQITLGPVMQGEPLGTDSRGDRKPVEALRVSSCMVTRSLGGRGGSRGTSEETQVSEGGGTSVGA